MKSEILKIKIMKNNNQSPKNIIRENSTEKSVNDLITNIFEEYDEVFKALA